ncbi:hypothetical protein J7643_05650 [bacterium]|nr:hypothetical protein [bacterium]
MLVVLASGLLAACEDLPTNPNVGASTPTNTQSNGQQSDNKATTNGGSGNAAGEAGKEGDVKIELPTWDFEPV